MEWARLNVAHWIAEEMSPNAYGPDSVVWDLPKEKMKKRSVQKSRVQMKIQGYWIDLGKAMLVHSMENLMGWVLKREILVMVVIQKDFVVSVDFVLSRLFQHCFGMGAVKPERLAVVLVKQKGAVGCGMLVTALVEVVFAEVLFVVVLRCTVPASDPAAQ